MAVAFDPRTGDLLVVNQGSNNASLIGGSNGTVLASVPLGSSGGPLGAAYDAANGNFYVSLINNNEVVVVNATSRQVVGSPIPVGTHPFAIAYDSDNGQLYVANQQSNNVSAIDGSTDTVEANIDVGSAPYGIAFDDASGDLYVADSGNGGGDQVTVIDGATDKASATAITVGTNPLGLSYDPDNGDVYVADANSDETSIIDTSTGGVVGTPAAGAEPAAASFDAHNLQVYFADFGGGSGDLLSSVNGTTAQATTVPVGTAPEALAFDPWNQALYVANSNSDNVTVVSTYGTCALPSISLSSPSVSGATVSFAGAESAGSGGCTVASPDWSWGDGSSGSQAFPASHTYAAPGTYLVRASVLQSDGQANVAEQAVTVTGGVLTSVSVSPASMTLAEHGSGSLTATPVCSGGACPPGASYAWSMNRNAGSFNATTGSVVDFTAGSAPATTYLFVNATLDATTRQGGPVQVTIVSNPLTISSFTANPASLSVGASTFLNVTASGGTSPYSYDFTGLPPGCSTMDAASLLCTPSTTGTFTIRVYVNDTVGDSTTTSVSLTVSAAAFSLTVTATPQSGPAPLAVSFDAIPSGGTGTYTSYSWTFGDGDVGTGSSVTHTYTAAGTYTASATVVDSASATATSSVKITVSASGSFTAAASASPSSGKAPLAVQFSGAAAGGTAPLGYAWRFGDGGSSGSQSPSHTYVNPGDYVAWLWVNDSAGHTATASVAVTVSSSGGGSGGSEGVCGGELGWCNLTSSVAPPPSTGGSLMTYDYGDGYELLLTGPNAAYAGASVPPGQTWTYRGGRWTNITGTAGSPGPLMLGAMTYDAADGYVVYWEGYNDQTWSFKAGIWSKITTTGTSPPVDVGGGAMAYDPVDGYAVYFGGEGPYANSCYWGCNVTYTYHAGVWTQLNLAFHPDGRTGDSLVWDSAGGYLVLHGGEGSPSSVYCGDDVAFECNDTWSFVGGQWSKIPSLTGYGPNGLRLVYDPSDNELIGQTTDCSATAGTWVTLDGQWVRVDQNLTILPPHGLEARDYDDGDGYFLGFGGDGCFASNQTWIFRLPFWVGVPSAAPLSGDLDAGQGSSLSAGVVTVQSTGPYAYGWSLPTGCASVNASSLSCTPTAGGEFTVNLTVSEHGVGWITSPSLPYLIWPPLVVGRPTLRPSTYWVGSSQTLDMNVSVAGGDASDDAVLVVYWSGLPAGCPSLDDTVLDAWCAPTVPGTYHLQVFVKDSNGNNVSSPVAELHVLPANGSAGSLTSVSVTPTQAGLAFNGSTTFTASASCVGTCASGLVWAWTLSNSLGSLSSATGPTTTFRAGAQGGTAVLTVTASLEGENQSASASITVSRSGGGGGSGSSPSAATLLGLPLEQAALLLGLLVAVVVGVVVARARRRRARLVPPHPSAEPGPPASGPAPASPPSPASEPPNPPQSPGTGTGPASPSAPPPPPDS